MVIMVKLSFNFRSGDHASSDSETADSSDNSDQFSESDDHKRSEEEIALENIEVDQTR